MPRYMYRALNRQGSSVRGEWVASNIHELEQKLLHLGLELINAKIAQRHGFFWQSLSHQRDLMDFCFYLEQIIESELSLLQGLQEMQEVLTSPRLKNIVANISDSVENGKTLSEAIAIHGNFFGPFFAPLLAAGEKTGHMTKVMHCIYSYIEWRVDFTMRIKNMLTYPAVSLFFICLSLIAIFVFVMPEMQRFFEGLQIDMPWYTHALLILSNFIMKNWVYVGIMICLFPISFIFAYVESDRFRIWLGHLMMSAPFLGHFLTTIFMLRFLRVVVLGVSSGIPFLESLKLSLPVISNAYVASRVDGIYKSIQRGIGISEAFKRSGLFESIVIQFIHVAEKTGELERVLNQSIRFYEYELKRKMELVETWLQPILLTLVSILLGWVMMSILGAIYQNLERLPV